MSVNESLAAHEIFSNEDVVNNSPSTSEPLTNDYNSSKYESLSKNVQNIITHIPEAISSKKNERSHWKSRLFYCNCYSKKSFHKKLIEKDVHLKESLGRRYQIANNSSSDPPNLPEKSKKSSDDDQHTNQETNSTSPTLARFRTLWEGRRSGKFKNPFRKSLEKLETGADISIYSRDDSNSTICLKPTNTCDSTEAVATDSSFSVFEISEQRSSNLLGPALENDLKKKCFIIDLDETLVHSSFKAVDGADFQVGVEIDGVVHQVYVLKRPYVDEFLQAVGDIYECVLFTASLSKYADPVADFLDKQKVFRYRLFREACVFHHGNYVKDLSQLGRAIDQVVILDNSPASYMFHATHAIQITSWFDDMSDRALLELIPYFQRLSSEPNVVEFLRHNPPSSKYAVVGSFDMNLLASVAVATTSRASIGNAILSRVSRPPQSLSSDDTSSRSNSVRRSIFSTALALSTLNKTKTGVVHSPNDKKVSSVPETSKEHSVVTDKNAVIFPVSNLTEKFTNYLRRSILSPVLTTLSTPDPPPSSASEISTSDQNSPLVSGFSAQRHTISDSNSLPPHGIQFTGQFNLLNTSRSLLRSKSIRPISTPSYSNSTYNRSAFRKSNSSAPVTPKTLSRSPRNKNPIENPIDPDSPKRSHPDA